MSDLWAAVSALAGVLNVFVVLVALAYAWSQLREASRARSASVALEFQSRHEANPLREARARLLTGAFRDPASGALRSDLTAQDLKDLELVVDHYETLAVLVKLGLLDAEVARAIFRFTPARVWEQARPWIEQMQQAAPGSLRGEAHRLIRHGGRDAT